GVPAARVRVIPLGADPALFTPDGGRLPVVPPAGFTFLFVGGTIHRKGIDVLLDAYARAFTDNDDGQLVIKDMGVGSFYNGQTAEALIADFRSAAGRPRVVYLDGALDDPEMAALYRSADCLVHPYRGRGSGSLSPRR